MPIRVIHITPHLGGGVGKALAEVSRYTSAEIERTFILLEEPKDMRFIQQIEGAGSSVITASRLNDVELHIERADIVQVEWWNHPRVFEWLVCCDAPKMRTVFWSHVSGLNRPYIPEKLFAAADCFLFTSACSFQADYISRQQANHLCDLGVVNSGFGFSCPSPSYRGGGEGEAPRIAYLGTVDFEKMHESFFDCIDKVQGHSFQVSLWGECASDSVLASKVANMDFPSRVSFEGLTDNPQVALSKADIFLYLLRRDHYGTGENALVEAMSVGCVPIVLNNPAEVEIVQDEVTGYIAKDIEDAARIIQYLLDHPEKLKVIGRNAANDVAMKRMPGITCNLLDNAYRRVMKKEKKKIVFAELFGHNPIEWFLSTQSLADQHLERNFLDCQRFQSQWCYARFKACFPSYFNAN